MVAYRIQTSRVVYEILNTEVVAVDFNTGNYYALLHVAKEVWRLIEQHRSVEEMAQAIAASYGVGLAQVTADLNPFIAQLSEHGLIEITSGKGEGAELEISLHTLPYEAPQLQIYTDVQNLLLLDPVHEVAEAGWPEKG